MHIAGCVGHVSFSATLGGRALNISPAAPGPAPQGNVSVEKDVLYADRAKFFPWRPRLWMAAYDILIYSAVAQALMLAWALLSPLTAGTQPIIWGESAGGGCARCCGAARQAAAAGRPGGGRTRSASVRSTMCNAFVRSCVAAVGGWVGGRVGGRTVGRPGCWQRLPSMCLPAPLRVPAAAIAGAVGNVVKQNRLYPVPKGGPDSPPDEKKQGEAPACSGQTLRGVSGFGAPTAHGRQAGTSAGPRADGC